MMTREPVQGLRWNTMDVFMCEVEMAVCLEAVTRACYLAMVESIRNGRVVRECQLFSKEAMLGQQKMKRFLIDPDASRKRIECVCRNYAVDAARLSVAGIIEAALHSARNKLGIYRHLAAISGWFAEVFGREVLRTQREIRFLQNEQAFQKDKDNMLPHVNWWLRLSPTLMISVR